MSALAADIAKVAALGAPVLCIDTCTVLDIMRDPTRDTVRAHERKAALDLLLALETGTALVSLVAEQVHFEFHEHANAVEAEAVRALQKLRDQLARIDGVAAAFGGVGRADLSHLDDHMARSRGVVDRWMAASHMAPASVDISHRAFVRVNQARTPARKGQHSIKDCVVIETYLDVIGELRAAGLGSTIVFTSSNTRDYAGESGQALKPDLAIDFAKVGMEYAPNLAAAKHLLGL